VTRFIVTPALLVFLLPAKVIMIMADVLVVVSGLMRLIAGHRQAPASN
jgi:hypothetical protein